MRPDRALEHGDETEISLGLVWRDTSIALSLVIGAFLVETAKDLLFHEHLPLTLNITLFLAEIAMCLLALYHVSIIINHLTPLQRLFALSLGYYRSPSPIGPIGWGFLGALIFLILVVAALTLKSAFPALSASLLSVSVVFIVVLLAGATNLAALRSKAGVLFLSIPTIFGGVLVTLYIIAWMLQRALGGDFTVRSLVGMLLG